MSDTYRIVPYQICSRCIMDITDQDIALDSQGGGAVSTAILNRIDYRKEDVMKQISDRIGWQYYGGKHYGSIYTRFYQGYVLPAKFNVDKRIAHLSGLIHSGQMIREETLLELSTNKYINSGLCMQYKAYVCKKFCFNEDKFTKIMLQERKTFRDYPNSHKLIWFLKILVNKLRYIGFISK